MAFPKSLVIVPTYNEKENILLIMSAILEQNECLEILVVDDGSPDGTGDLVQAEVDKNPRIHLLRRKGKMGLGSAYVMGFKWALERDYERVFEKNRRISVVNWDLRRLILSYGANVYTRIVTGLPISDATGGFKCFRREALQALNLDKMKSDGYCFQIETTFKIWKKGLRVKEIPIIFTDRTRGTSKMSGGIISEAFFLVLKLRLGLA